MATVPTRDGGAISYTVHGNGAATLLFMHGWAGSAPYFDEVIGEIDLNALRIVTMDLRGHGKSSPALPPWTLDGIADDVWSVVDAAGAGDVILAGFSMSGKFAQYVASCRPDRVSGLVLISGFPASQIPFPEEVARDWVGRAGNRERIGELLAPFISEPVDPAILDRFLDDAIRVPAAVLEGTLRTCIGASFAERVESLQMPTLVVGGKRDPIFPPDAVASMARSLPCARGVCFDCNHEIPMERPHDLAHVLEAFVAGLGVGCRSGKIAGVPVGTGLAAGT